MESKNFKIEYGHLGDYKIYVRILNKEGLTELENLGYFFDDFCGGGTEKWIKPY